MDMGIACIGRLLDVQIPVSIMFEDVLSEVYKIVALEPFHFSNSLRVKS